jgi:hypothetical protein
MMYLLIQTLRPQTISTLPAHTQQLGPTASLFDLLDNVISSLTATANKHFQKFEQRKYMRSNKGDNEANIIDGDVAIGELIKANMVLLSFVIDPHGRWGPILQHFLSFLDKALDYNFPQH